MPLPLLSWELIARLKQVHSGAAIAWHQESFARGAFVLFTPGQMEMYKDIVRPEVPASMLFRPRLGGRGRASWVAGRLANFPRGGCRISRSATDASE
jgi:hypothetical protein